MVMKSTKTCCQAASSLYDAIDHFEVVWREMTTILNDPERNEAFGTSVTRSSWW